MDLLRASPAPPPDVNETGSVIFCCWEGRPAFAEEVASSNTPETAQKRSKLSRFAKEKKDLKTIHEDQLRRAVDADDRHADGRAARVGAAREGGQGKLLKDSVSTLVKDNTAFKMANKFFI